jgi:uncharacterized protein YdeI (YjbR/CyaY-like superfamily)
MPTKDKRVDAYIANSADFAKPILNHIRQLVHKTCPDVEEKMKWSFPHFDYKGMMCSMAAFNEHCALNFWKASLLKNSAKLLHPKGESSMGNFGKIQKLSDLPSDKILIGYIKEAMRLNDDGVKIAYRPKTTEKKPLVVPDYLKAALKKNKKASETFENFNYSNKKEYLMWLTEAKTEETRSKRLADAIKWMAEGKVRNWKYLR